MTMHVVLGDGEMTRKELTETIQDLYDKSANADDTFWLLVQAKPEPTATDQALMSWVAKNEIYFETVGDGTDVDEIYEGAQNQHTAKRLPTKIVNLLGSQPEDGEEADILALFVSDDPDAPEDAFLNETIQTAMEQGYKVYALNDGMVEVDLSDEAAEEEAEPEEEEPAPRAKKSAAKKTAAPAKKSAAKAAPAEDEEDDETGEMTREFLEERSLEELKEIASNRGITLPPRTRMGTYIDAILGEGRNQEVEVQEEDEEEDDGGTVQATNGGSELISAAMMIIVLNGTVTARPLTPEEARELLRT